MVEMRGLVRNFDERSEWTHAMRRVVAENKAVLARARARAAETRLLLRARRERPTR